MKKHFLLTPGPTPIPPEVAQKESLPILHHRTSEFSELFKQALEGLKYIFQTKNDVFVMASSGTGAMESAVVNLLCPQEEVIVATCGKFGERWTKLCQAYGIKTTVIEAPAGQAIDPLKVEQALRANPRIKCVFTQHTETSTGVVNDLRALGEIVKKTTAVLAVDAISGLCGQELRMDDWSLDVVVSGSQKGFMCAPGLSFASVSAKAWSLVEKASLPRFYFDYRPMKKNIAKAQTPFTPAVTLIVALNEAINMVRNEGLDNIFARTARLSKACRAGLKALNLELFTDEKTTCAVLTSAKAPSGISAKKIVKTLREEFGISIAAGQGELEEQIIRVAHMGYIDQFDLYVALAGLEIVLSKLGHKVEFGKSIAAAQAVLSQ